MSRWVDLLHMPYLLRGHLEIRSVFILLHLQCIMLFEWWLLFDLSDCYLCLEFWLFVDFDLIFWRQRMLWTWFNWDRFVRVHHRRYSFSYLHLFRIFLWFLLARDLADELFLVRLRVLLDDCWSGLEFTYFWCKVFHTLFSHCDFITELLYLMWRWKVSSLTWLQSFVACVIVGGVFKHSHGQIRLGI